MVVIILTLFVIVPMVTTVSLRDYFTTKKTWEYLLGITIPFSGTRFTLPGFSTGANVKFADAINGSLWTLSGEIKCYLIVAFLGVTRLIKFRYLILLTWIIVIINFNLHLDSNIARFHTYFGSGIIYYLFKDKIKHANKFTLLAVTSIILSCYFGKFWNVAMPIAGAYLLFGFAYSERIRLYNFGKYGDFSYGIYLYGFLVQQLVIRAFHGQMSNTLNYLISLPIAIICGIISYKIIEKPCMKLKSRFL